MPNPLLVFRVGYMPSYNGIGPILGGGAYVEENGIGGEMWNFRVEGGRCYGYVMTRKFAGVNLNRLNSKNQWESNEELEGIDIVFISKKQELGQVVVGWYQDATVFHKKYRKRRGNKILGDWNKLDYLCQVSSEKAVLLPEELRTFEVPFAPVHGKGFPGQSNIWYPNTDTPEVSKFVNKLRKYINSSTPSALDNQSLPRKTTFWSNYPDKDLITQIEQAAISATRIHYQENGYTVISVEKDNRGWDIEVTKNEERLLIEVKGHIGNVIQFELTPNEYNQLQLNKSIYRISVVRNALEESEVEIYIPEKKQETWILNRCNGNGVIELSEKIAARAYEAK